MSRYLIALDFDHTVVDDNTDIVARNLLSPDKISEDVRKLYKSSDWINYMQCVFRLLHQHNFGREAILGAITGIKEVPGFVEFICKIQERGDVDVIIISDSNSEFISTWLKHQKIERRIRKVFTNPAEFDKDGLLNIQPYHHQTECSLSSINLCKGQILDDFRAEENYSNCIYVGDGRNDFCPRLDGKDLICPRAGYSCEKILEEHKAEVRATVFSWSNGYDLLFKASKQIKDWTEMDRKC